MSAWATTIISGLVLVVAFMQWRTAHQKVVLDLFDRRMRVYEQVEEALSYVIGNKGNLVRSNARRKFAKAWMDSRFIFGEDVQSKILDLDDKASALAEHSNLSNVATLDAPELAAAEEQRQALEDALLASHSAFSNTCRAYMAMDQKIIGTPFQWIAERNRIRLSYADEKQK